MKLQMATHCAQPHCFVANKFTSLCVKAASRYIPIALRYYKLICLCKLRRSTTNCVSTSCVALLPITLRCYKCIESRAVRCCGSCRCQLSCVTKIASRSSYESRFAATNRVAFLRVTSLQIVLRYRKLFCYTLKHQRATGGGRRGTNEDGDLSTYRTVSRTDQYLS